MSDTHPPAGQPGHEDATHGSHATQAHDEHSHVSDPLGPVDLTAWGSGLAGIALGIVVAACLFVAAGGI
jgi:hypothetical protein